jgi:hypothetical protein
LLKKIALIVLLAWSPAVLAGSMGGVSAPDPYTLIFPTVCCGYVSQKTVASQTADPAKRTLVIVAAGQSLGGNNSGGSYTATNASKIRNLNIYDGGIYAATNPLLGTASDQASLGPGNFLLRLADDLVSANKFDDIIIVSTNVGGTSVQEWETGNERDRLSVAYRRLAAKGITPGLTNLTMIILWIQGEQGSGPTQAAYFASLANVITASRAAGFTQSNVTWFVPIETYLSGATNAGIQQAQSDTVNHANNIWVGPIVDNYIGSVCGPSANQPCRQPDNTHLSADGAYSVAGTNGGGWRAALAAFGAPF